MLVLLKASVPLGKFLAFFSPPLSYFSQKGRGVSKYVEIDARGVGVQVTGMVGYIERIRKCHGGTGFILVTCHLVVTAAVDVLLVTAMNVYMHPSLNSKNTEFCMCIYIVALGLFDCDHFV